MLTWTGEMGRVLGAIVEGGAKVVGFDMVIPASIELSEIPFGEGVLGEKLKGFDRDFMRALATASTSGKIVLGEILAAISRSGPRLDSASPFASSRTSGRSTSTPTATTWCAGCRLRFPSTARSVPGWRLNWRRARLAPRPIRPGGR